MIALQRILVPTDFSEFSDAALKYGVALARTFGSSIHLLHVVTAPMPDPLRNCPTGVMGEMHDFEAHARQCLASLVAAGDLAASRVVTAAIDGDPSEEILRYARSHDMDLIVCGTHGLSGWNRLMRGSVATMLVRKSSCPVLTVHHPEHEFVVPDMPVDRARGVTFGSIPKVCRVGA
jgi:nucleotide-binding universal stress UspA family protein